MHAKICGITRLKDAQLALKNGAWALGFNFYPHSARYVDPIQAKELIQYLPKSILKIGILPCVEQMDAEQLMDHIGLDLLQVYHPVTVSAEIKQRMILSCGVNCIQDLPQESVLAEYGYILLDAISNTPELPGGTGRRCHWGIAKSLAKKYRLILAGGLTPKNVRFAIDVVRPFAVDVASGVESRAGRKSSKLLKQFLNQVIYD